MTYLLVFFLLGYLWPWLPVKVLYVRMHQHTGVAFGNLVFINSRFYASQLSKRIIAHEIAHVWQFRKYNLWLCWLAYAGWYVWACWVKRESYQNAYETNPLEPPF